MTENGAGKHSLPTTADGRRKRQYNPAGLLVAGFLFVLVGTPLGISSLVDGYTDQHLIDTGTKAQGTVTDIRESRSKNGRHEHVTVTYTAKGGEWTVEGSHRMKTPGFEPTLEDSKQTVYYDPEDPAKAVILGWDAKMLDGYAVGGGFVGIGAVMMGISLWRIKKMPLPPAADHSNGAAVS
ncbi:DUF3592 domain-containing protein [Arthrobacter sp. zg-Y20]|uniref:DUF3592 domain-containing protein n=1 Tax=unclassified Arthrobacter TaxID=235627 RepID=UPI001D1469C5|nr:MULTISPECIES: DUF3592 domain-containing protein [unclassified Arthrobacter]MCC3277365.1 DUF3592 domain-containing protein [Arthrobacter sp. zg-Y20]MDK1317525.1 DUF3592 domain-containing protein [Arthrobacter sp. zg.Y20]WIB06977.1 DUF3592 domain-containing protein [Arthrobacter sp. zg-Y20]